MSKVYSADDLIFGGYAERYADYRLDVDVNVDDEDDFCPFCGCVNDPCGCQLDLFDEVPF